jgi:hypothetical protein
MPAVNQLVYNIYRPRGMRWSCLAVALAVLTAAGCSNQKRESAAAEAAPAHDPHGRWTVVAHHIPGVSAMSDEEAMAWHGRVFELGENQAIFTGDTCQAVTYGSGTRRADRFLGEDYHVAPFTLGIEDSTIYLTWVSCDGEFRRAPGGVLIWKGQDWLLTPWNGVFFELHREESAR